MYAPEHDLATSVCVCASRVSTPTHAFEVAPVVEEQKPWVSMYPFKGIAYFASNRELWTTVAVPLVVTAISSVAIAIVMVLFTLEPQAHLLERVLPDVASWPIAIVLVAAETLTALFIVIQLLFVRTSCHRAAWCSSFPEHL